MARESIPERRLSVTTKVDWTGPLQQPIALIVTYGIVHKSIKEVFCAGFKRDSDMVALANDACVLLSRLLQHGESISQLRKTLGGDCMNNQPASLIGAIVIAGVDVEANL